MPRSPDVGRLDAGRRVAAPQPEVERIAVLRANGIGDFLFAQPALEALRLAYPEAELTLLGSPWHAELLQGRPSPIDEVVVVPISRGVREVPGKSEDPRELAAFFEEMRSRRFDLAVQMHGGGRWSNPFVAKLGARLTAGMRTPDALALDIAIPYVYYQHEVMRLLELVAALGGPLVPPVPRLAVTRSDLAEARRLLTGVSRPALIHASAGDPRRRWPAEKFAALGDALASEGLQPILVGGPDAITVSAGVREAMRREALDLTGKASLAGLIGMAVSAELLVSNDSGPLHLAAAVGTPTVGIYWCGNMINAQLPFRSDHRPILSWRLTCPSCGVDCTQGECNHEASFVADIPVDEVLAACQEVARDEAVRLFTSA